MLSLAVNNQTRRNVPDIPFSVIVKKVLNRRVRYDLSLVFVTPAKARALNRTYRRKSYEANVLSFLLSENSGEIFINLSLAEREAKKFDESYRDHIAHLLIHGLLHLKGMAHGSKMEKEEKNFLHYFTNDQKSHRRPGHRHLVDQTRHLRK